MDRRQFVAALSAASLGSLAGCVGDLGFDAGNRPQKAVGLYVRSYFQSQQTVKVIIDALHGDAQYETEVWILPGDVVRKRNILEAGSYHVEARVEDEMWQETDWHMGECSRDNVVIEIGEDGIGISSTCHQ